jgi:hypothetical protein
MQNTNNVYSWKVFITFVKKACKHKSMNSHPVLDAVARDLLAGVLQRRDKLGHPLDPWRTLSELRESFLLMDEVNARPIMKQWLLVWAPVQRQLRKLTPLQEVKKYGWKMALQLESLRIQDSYKAGGARIVRTQLAIRVHAYAAKNTITTDGVLIPSSEYIRTHVVSKKDMGAFTTQNPHTRVKNLNKPEQA